jgi:hypothetical protein
MKLIAYLRQNRIITTLARLHYRTRGQHGPCRHCLIEWNGWRNEPRYVWLTCDHCEWGNE